jgi:hypothetical protein
MRPSASGASHLIKRNVITPLSPNGRGGLYEAIPANPKSIAINDMKARVFKGFPAVFPR